MLAVIQASLISVLLLSCFSVTAFALGPPSGGGSGDVAGAIENTWNTASDQIKQVVDYGNFEWYGHKPTAADYKSLSESVDSYLDAFAPVEEMGMKMY